MLISLNLRHIYYLNYLVYNYKKRTTINKIHTLHDLN